jgi:hypothetical protein
MEEKTLKLIIFKLVRNLSLTEEETNFVEEIVNEH